MGTPKTNSIHQELIGDDYFHLRKIAIVIFNQNSNYATIETNTQRNTILGYLFTYQPKELLQNENSLTLFGVKTKLTYH